MASIEIPIEEYNAYKDKIKALENTIANMSKEVDFYKGKYQDIESLVEDLKKESIISRAFKWKSVTEPLVKSFNNIF